MNLAAVPTSLFVVTGLLFLEGTARSVLTTNYRKVAINGPVCGSLVASCRHGAIIKNGPMWAVRVKTPPSLINVPRSALLGETKSPCAALTAQPNAPLWKSDCRQCLFYCHGIDRDWLLQINWISFFSQVYELATMPGTLLWFLVTLKGPTCWANFENKENVKCYSLAHESQTETAANPK